LFVLCFVEDEKWEELDYCFLACDAVMSCNQGCSYLHSHHKYHGENDILALATQIESDNMDNILCFVSHSS
jgi:hypothetical protein